MRAAPRTLLRFPGPLVLLRVLAGERPTLHQPGAARVFLGDERLWDWPGVREFGALALFDADRFSPEPHGIEGWFTSAVALIDPLLGPEDTLYVPDAECASMVSACRTARAARRRLPPDHGPRVERARAAMVAYDGAAAQVEAGRARGAASTLPPALRALLNRPLHMLTPAERAALVQALG